MVGSTACSSLPYGVIRGGKTLFLKGSVHANPKESSHLFSTISHLASRCSPTAHSLSYHNKKKIVGRPSYSKRFQKALLPSPIITPVRWASADLIYYIPKKPRLICDYLVGNQDSDSLDQWYRLK